MQTSPKIIGTILSCLVSDALLAACPTGVPQVQNTTASTRTTATFTFGTLNANKVLTIGGLGFEKIASGPSFSASTTASAYASLSDGATSGTVTGQPSNSYQYSGTLSGWTTSAVGGTTSNPTVTFTATPGNTSTTITWSENDPTSVNGTPVITPGTTASGALSTLLLGNTVCVGSSGNWQAQEFHQSGGDLIDWKQGLNNPVDSTTSVGSWSITGTGTATRVVYIYGGTTYTDAVYDLGGGQYLFCDQNGNTTTAIYIKSGQVAC
ncbi:hypothetical protein [Methylomagnum ishizawai]|uniref:hypothetical protein n=1 Tax=Methylomagnum ishizawai TaxID=1760988 RepID=UPI001C7EE373|nr:hypothetical protein [Methylomagnum ishizawai]